MRGAWGAVAALLLSASAQAEVDLVVVGPGEPIWSRFGHVLLRVDDRCYDFASNPSYDEAFVWDYFRGEARFRVVAEPWDDVFRRNVARDRSIWTRPLRLTPTERVRLRAALEAATAPDRRAYVYEHQRDNCVTRLRDVLDAVTGGALRRAAHAGGTYRPETLGALAGLLGAQIGIDLIGGPSQEIAPDAWAWCYLPERLDEVVAGAVRGDGSRIAGSRNARHVRSGPPVHQGTLYDGRIAVLLGAVAAAVAILLSRRAGGAVALLVTSAFAAAGTLLWALAALSAVRDYAWSDNALLFWPLDLLLLLTAYRRLRGRPGLSALARRYLDLRLALVGIYAVLKVLGLFPQDNWTFVGAAAAVLLALRAER